MHSTPDGSSPAGTSRRAAVLARLDDAAVTATVRTGVSPRAVVGLLVVALVVAAVLGVRVLVAHAAARPQPIAPAAAPPVRLVSAGGPTPGPTASGAPVLVHVVGQVRRPGVVRLRPGARVLDALAAAGGATRRADLAAVNLARPVVDGEQVVVPRPGESAPTAAGPASSGSSEAGGGGPAPAPVDLNSATVTELDELPGIGPVLAGRIVQFRDQHGRYSSVDELSEVSGIGEALLERLRPLVRV
jgi:competence protein ComEA